MAKDIITTASEAANLESPGSADFEAVIQEKLCPEALQPISFSPEGEPNVAPMDQLRIISWLQKEKCKHIAKELQERLLPAGQPERHLPRYFKRALQGFKADVKSANDDTLEIGQILGISKEDIKPLLINRDAILAERQAALF